jgi:hypothetical protein
MISLSLMMFHFRFSEFLKVSGFPASTSIHIQSMNVELTFAKECNDVHQCRKRHAIDEIDTMNPVSGFNNVGVNHILKGIISEGIRFLKCAWIYRKNTSKFHTSKARKVISGAMEDDNISISEGETSDKSLEEYLCLSKR